MGNRHALTLSAKANVLTLGTKPGTQTSSFGLLNDHEVTDHWKAEELHCTAAWCFLGLQAKNISTVSGQVSSLKLICPGQIVTDSNQI